MNYSEFQSLAGSRASHRKFLADDIPGEDIKKIIDIARLAPSGHNNQPWKFIALKKTELIKKLASAIALDLNGV